MILIVWIYSLDIVNLTINSKIVYDMEFSIELWYNWLFIYY